MILTSKCKKDFNNQKNWYFNLLPKNLQNLIIYRWFNSSTNIAIDIQNWVNDGFDYAIFHPYVDEVYHSKKLAGNRIKDFDLMLVYAIEKANEIYNQTI